MLIGTAWRQDFITYIWHFSASEALPQCATLAIIGLDKKPGARAPPSWEPGACTTEVISLLNEEYPQAGCASSDVRHQEEGQSDGKSLSSLPPMAFGGRFARNVPLLAFCLDLNTNDLRVYAALLYHAGPRHRAWPTAERLAEETGLSVRTVRRCLCHLREVGLIKPEGRIGKNRATIYRIFDADELDENLRKLKESPTATDTPSKIEVSIPVTSKPSGNGSKICTASGSKNSRSRNNRKKLDSGEVTKWPTFEGTEVTTSDFSISEIAMGTAMPKHEEEQQEEEEQKGDLGKNKATENFESLQLREGKKAFDSVEGDHDGPKPTAWEALGLTSKPNAFSSFGGFGPHTLMLSARWPAVDPAARLEKLREEKRCLEESIRYDEAQLAHLEERLKTDHPSKRDAIEKDIRQLRADLGVQRIRLRQLTKDIAALEEEMGVVAAGG